MHAPPRLWLDKITYDANGFNPTVITTTHGRHLVYRRTHGTFARKLGPNETTLHGKEYAINPQLEDCRTIPGAPFPMLSGTLYAGLPRMILLLLADHDETITPLFHPQPIALAPTRRKPKPRPEKNWLIWTPNPRTLRAIYQAAPFTLAEPANAPHTWTTTHTQNWQTPPWTRDKATQLRGSAGPLTLPDGNLLIFWHLKDASAGYWTGASLHTADWPHWPFAATDRPLLTPDDATAISPHWPPNRCIFPMSAELTINDTVKLWAGDSDRTCICLFTTLTNILNLMAPTQ